MKHSRKVLSFLLILSILLSLIIFPSFADEPAYTYKYAGSMIGGQGSANLFWLN